MSKVVIAGASGMVGGIILNECIHSSKITDIISLVRKSSGITNSKLKEVIIHDFSNAKEIASAISNSDIAFFCIGAYTGSLPDDEFKKVTVDYAIAFADALKSTSSKVTLCFLSGAGADLNEKSKLPFARYKGMAENYLLRAKFSSLYIFRPAYIYPVEKRIEPNFSYRIIRSLYPILKLVYPQGEIPSTDLAKAMFNAGIFGSGEHILENVDIKKLTF